MVDAISSKTVSTVKPPVADTSAGGSVSARTATYKPAVASDQPVNPRLVYDRLAGIVVTEFLSHTGDVQLQTPSSAVLAYLRVGLGADGHSKYQPETEPKKPDTTFDS